MQKDDDNIWIVKDYLTLYGNTIDPTEKKFLLDYLTNEIRKDPALINRKECITKENILEDLKKLNLYLHDSDSTTLVIERVNKTIDILNKLINTDNEDDLLEISYELEKLYMELGLEPRNTDTVQLVLEKRKRNE